MKPLFYRLILFISCSFICGNLFSQSFTSGIGIYPGSPGENFSPELITDNAYRNLALHRACYHSSSYDYNLTAQLLTDGIIDNRRPCYLEAVTNEGKLPVREREWAIDGGEYSRNILMGGDAFIQYDWHGQHFKADKIQLTCTLAYRENLAGKGYSIQVFKRDGKGKWIVVGEYKGGGMLGKKLNATSPSDPNKQTKSDLLPTRFVQIDIPMKDFKNGFDALRLSLKMPGVAHWDITEIKFFHQERRITDFLSSNSFTSCWMSADKGPQWVYVDLGKAAEFDEVRLHWINKAKVVKIDVSDDALDWQRLVSVPTGKKPVDIVPCKGKGRYVRVLMDQPVKGEYYMLSELEVMGKGGLKARPHQLKGMANGDYFLSGGNWKLQRASQIATSGERISLPGYDDSRWIAATVPATVLSSYVNIGALPDPNYADNLFYISESFFNSDFWYRDEFTLPNTFSGKHIFLNFDGINWKADVFLNGKKINRIEGAFLRGKTEVTDLLRKGSNVLAVHIVKTAHPGAIKEKNELNTDFNGGILGADNPTFHATIGWDWISTIRGRDIGIWNDVFLSSTDEVELQDPLVVSSLALPDTLATIMPSVVVRNHETHAVRGVLKGRIGDITFEKNVTLPAVSSQTLAFDPSEFSVLKNRKMNLWWPNNYGTPYLYDAAFSFVIDGRKSDEVAFKAGIRQFDYKDVDTQFKMYINGKRFVPLGGNWGFSENNLNYRGREYDIAVRYHKNMNFNMIRNWVGQTGDEEFYQACDKYGIVVWQDFWLANPADGPDPDNEEMFMSNAADYILRIRNHPSIGLYCGRNEGYPPKSIDNRLRSELKLHHQDIAYISSSADDGVSGHGPYRALMPQEYFKLQTGKLHSERGMPNVMTYEGLSRTLKTEMLWPQNNYWGQHDYVLQGAQRGESFNKIISDGYGMPANARDFTALAQFVNYDGYRAMFESDNKDRLGLLIWMSHSCWPSMTWQTYDYYFEPTAAFFGAKKACEPLHIQWNAYTDNVEVVNLCKETQQLTAHWKLMDLNGKELSCDSMHVDCPIDTTIIGPRLSVSDDYKGVYLLSLNLQNRGGKSVSSNFYISSTEEGDYQQLNTLPEISLQTEVNMQKEKMVLKVKNTTETPAIMIRLNLKGSDGEQILPVDYTDNYFSLMPGDEKTVTIGWKTEDARNTNPMIELSGFNVNNQLFRQ